MGFDDPPLLVYNPTQLALHGLEGIVDHFLKRFVGTVIHLPFIGYEFMARRHGHIDPTPVWISLVMIVICLLDRDIAAVDVVTKSLKPCGIFQNEIVDLIRFFQTPVRYLNRQLHDYLDNTVGFAGEGTKNLRSAFIKLVAKTGNGRSAAPVRPSPNRI